MSDPARIRPTPLFRGLPEDIVVWEILVRLPAKALVRCRTVCRSWRRVASTRDFLLAHHSRQPSLPLVHLCQHGSPWGNLRAFDHRASAAAGEARLLPVARIDDSTAISVDASCDGLLLLLWVRTFSPYRARTFVCNPTTRQIGHVPQLQDFRASGIYRHRPTGECRLLLHRRSQDMYGEKDPCYVLASGCDQLQPRCIGCPPELAGFFHAAVLVRGDLHWSWWPYPVKDQSGKKITVFDTSSESFRLMRTPIVQAGRAYLYEVDGTLGMYSHNDAITVVDIWVMQDYEIEVWSFEYKVKLPVAEIRELESRDVVVIHEERGVFVLYNYGPRLFLVDTEGKVLASSLLDAYIALPATHRIKQILCST